MPSVLKELKLIDENISTLEEAEALLNASPDDKQPATITISPLKSFQIESNLSSVQ